MRTLALASFLALAHTSAALAQPLLPSDREELRAEPGVLVHPTLGLRLRDIGLPRDDDATPHALQLFAGLPLTSVVHAWAYASGEDVVRVVLVSGAAPRALSRQMVRRGVEGFTSLGAVAQDRSDDGGASTATLSLGARTVVLRAIPFRDRGRGLVVCVSVTHLDAALARTIAASLDVPVPTPVVASESGLSREDIRATIRAWIGDVRECYEAALAARPELTGRVTASFLVRANGTVQTAAISATTLHDAGVESCIVDVVRSLRFPALAGGGIVGVNYPFVLDTSD